MSFCRLFIDDLAKALFILSTCCCSIASLCSVDCGRSGESAFVGDLKGDSGGDNSPSSGSIVRSIDLLLVIVTSKEVAGREYGAGIVAGPGRPAKENFGAFFAK
eukprot:CAMPEP_0184301406 /NCGR_PEP_ID=MMETSP1049-20130417/11621_1 /TAXON_ID=77928 /ORGANISM="Proteomonas sulcata, Strain CCMP704" /LENGTH=103 /DNA_ID=CAMNT_0026612403 /DNA_START=19 /DNA_END=330 /DNA_ORIENTATION=-